MKRMIRGISICCMVFFFVACSSEPPGVLIGFSTELRLRNENRIHMTEEDYKFFAGILQTDPKNHFSGKKYLAFDTIYTSTQRKLSSDPISALSNNDGVRVIAVQKEKFSSVFYSKRGLFIYRTFIPETAHKQTVIVDVASTDSTKISEYFYSSKVNSLIK